MAVVFPRPKERYLFVEREKVEGMSCPKCGSTNIARYPVLKSSGWVIATKCQDCMYTLETKPTESIYGTFSPLSKFLPRKPME